MFQSCFRLHRHVRNYANEKVVLANHRTRIRGLSANCVTAGFAWLLKRPDNAAGRAYVFRPTVTARTKCTSGLRHIWAAIGLLLKSQLREYDILTFGDSILRKRERLTKLFAYIISVILTAYTLHYTHASVV